MANFETWQIEVPAAFAAVPYYIWEEVLGTKPERGAGFILFLLIRGNAYVSEHVHIHM